MKDTTENIIDKERTNNDESKWKILIEKSEFILKEQLQSYTINHTKSGIVGTLTALFIPLILLVMDSKSYHDIIKYLSIIPIIILIFAIYNFISVLIPRNLKHGMNIDKFDSLVKKDYIEILRQFLGANKTSINVNWEIIAKQNKRLKTGLFSSLTSGVLITIIAVLGFLIPKKIEFEQNNKDIKVNKVEKIKMNNLNKIYMDDPENENVNQENDSTNSQSSEDENQIPDVLIEDTQSISKGVENDFETKDE